MSSEKTASYFKDKSEEEIINWMLANLSTDKITSCLGSQEPDKLSIMESKTPTLNDLRNYCSNKKYVIHKIVEDDVYFWYYYNGKWGYQNAKLEDFPKTINQLDSEECGSDTLITPGDMDDVKEAYNQDILSDNNKFTKSNSDDISESEMFNTVKKEYQQQGINEDWLSLLLKAIDIQKNTPSLQKYTEIFSFVPILIESVNKKNNTVNYYYLLNDNGNVRFIEANLKIDKFNDDMKEIVDDLELNIIKAGEPGSSSSRTIEEWKNLINTAMLNIDKTDLDRIKKIYSQYPLSKDSTFFMKTIFENDFGKCTDLKYVDLEMRVKNKFGSALLKRYKPKIINKNGLKTLVYIKK